MAGDWIKMRCDLPNDPAVIGIAAVVELDEDSVVGKLHRVWSWANSQTIDGNASSVTESWLDRYVRAPGFARAMAAQGWLLITSEGIQIPKFERHNGESAKQRALTSRRAEKHRAKSNAKSNAASVTKSAPREEKRREENNTPLPPNLDTEAFRKAWDDWAQHLKEKRKPLTPTSVKQQLAKLATWGPARAVAALQHSLANNWQGVFEPEGKQHDSSTNGHAGGRVGPAHRVGTDAAKIAAVERKTIVIREAGANPKPAAEAPDARAEKPGAD